MKMLFIEKCANGFKIYMGSTFVTTIETNATKEQVMDELDWRYRMNADKCERQTTMQAVRQAKKILKRI